MHLRPVRRGFTTWLHKRTVRRAGLALLLAVGMGVAHSLGTATERSRYAADRLRSAAQQLDDLTDVAPADDHRRAAIAWGYAERLRLGLESPFRLIESAARDQRLTADERRTVAWALLAHLLRGETHQLDPATLDGLGAQPFNRAVSGEQHLELIRNAVTGASNPRSSELAIRLAYTLAASERLVDAAAPVVVAGVAALTADGEIARREAAALVRSARKGDPIVELRELRDKRLLYVERPVLLAGHAALERDAIALSAKLLDSLRIMTPGDPRAAPLPAKETGHATLVPRLYAAGALLPPTAPLAVTVKRYLPLVRSHLELDHDALARTRNSEMLVAVTHGGSDDRIGRRAIGRLLVAAGVAMRVLAQQPVWFPGDSAPTSAQLISTFRLAGIRFDHDVPVAWRPYFLRQLDEGLNDARRVFPALSLDKVQVRFRMTSPADSALAMHDPRTRTLHLPVGSAGGTLMHELAHDLDRQQALLLGHAGYRSDFVARQTVTGPGRTATSNARLAASLRALTEEIREVPTSKASAERPAEIFATRVDWFVARALASLGRTSGFLTAVQDELLTGHVVHPARLRSAGRSRSLVTALEGMTPVASFAVEEVRPTAQSLLRWALAGPLDRGTAADLTRAPRHSWDATTLMGVAECDTRGSEQATLIRMAAESRARGWLRARARWTDEARRAGWAQAALGQGPWNEAAFEDRAARVRDHLLVELVAGSALPAGVAAYALPLAARARCAD